MQIHNEVMDPVEESPNNTIKIIKESWRSYSKRQKIQFAGIIVLVLAIPVLVGAIATARYIKSRAYPVTPPVPPVESPTPEPTSTPTSTLSPTPIACVQKVQTVTISPNTQSGFAGTALLYKISVTNNNGQGCTPSMFQLSTLVSSGWTGAVSNSLLTLESGKTGTAGIIFTSLLNAVPNSYPVSAIVDGPIAKTSATAAYQVLKPNPTPIPSSKATPTPTPVIIKPTPKSSPVISTWFLPVGRVSSPYKAVVSGYDANIEDRLSMNITGLPKGLSMQACSTQLVNSRKILSCTITGIPSQSGWFGNVTVQFTDNNGGNTTRRLSIFVLPNLRFSFR